VLDLAGTSLPGFKKFSVGDFPCVINDLPPSISHYINGTAIQQSDIMRFL
jgi:hypothetical protein